MSQLATAANYEFVKAAKWLVEAEHQAVRGDLDAIQECHLQMSEHLFKAKRALDEIRDICKANGDAQ